MSTKTRPPLSPELRDELQSRAIEAVRDDLAARAAAQPRAAGRDVAKRLLEQVELEAAEPTRIEPSRPSFSRGLTVPALPTDRPFIPTDVLWVYAPPYDATAINSWSDGEPGQVAAVGDTVTGEMNVALHIVDHSSAAWGFAGVGSWYVPRSASPALVEFRALERWSYTYELVAGALGEPAHSSGAFGARIFHWDQHGEDEQEMSDDHPLWAYGVDAWDWHHKDSDDNTTFISLQFPFDPSRHYLCVAYLFGACDAGGLPSSQATVDMIGTLPYFVTEEWGMNP
jgi:hypothetical protein